MKVLHIIARFIGGGPERHLLALANAWRHANAGIEQRVAVIEPPVSATLLLRARRAGMTLLPGLSSTALDDEIARADVVDLTYWNHPLLLDALRRPWPAARIVTKCAVSGLAMPQALPAELGSFTDAIIPTSFASFSTAALVRARDLRIPTSLIPALADMSRLDGFTPRPHPGIRVAYLGSIEPTKMHPRFAELTAAVRVPNIHFNVYGDGSWTPTLQRRLDALGASHRVHIHGHIEDIRDAFAEADIFGYPLAPGTSATCEKVIQEAMWAGIPPVILDGNGAAAWIRDGETGLVCTSEDDYPPAIERLANDASLRHRLSIGARDFARQHFCPHHNAARYLSLLQSAAALPKRTRTPFPGAGESPAHRFVRALGEHAWPFNESLAAGNAPAPAADARIAASTDIESRFEGGVVHYRNVFPTDPFLRYWSGLIAQYAGNHPQAASEFSAALELGGPRRRIEPPPAPGQPAPA